MISLINVNKKQKNKRKSLIDRVRYGGDRIKRKLFLSVLFLFGMALILNASSAATVGNTNSPTVTSTSPANHAVVSSVKSIKVNYSKPIKSGSNTILLKNMKGKYIQTKKSVSGNTMSVTPTNKLSIGTYTLIIHSGSVTDLSGNPCAFYKTQFTVSPLTLSQIKDGYARAQKFYNSNYRLPNYISYGSKKIPIATFQKIMATQNLKIKTLNIASTNKNVGSSIASIMKSASRFHYSGAASTGAAMERIGAGDCWAMSDWLFTHMKAVGIHARILQYPTAYSSRHRSVQYLTSSGWVDAPYRQYFSTDMFNDCSGKSSGSVICSC